MKKRMAIRYTLPVLLLLGIIILKFLSIPYIGLTTHYFLITPSILLVAQLCGLWPGILCAFVGSFLTEVWLIYPLGDYAIHFELPDTYVRSLFMVTMAAIIGFLSDRKRNQLWLLQKKSMDTAAVRVVKENADAERRKLLEEIEDLYQNAPCGYHSLDQNGTFVRINDTELKWLGYTRDEIIGKLTYFDVIPPESQAIVRENFPKYLIRGRVDNLRLTMIRKDRSTFPVVLSATAIYDDEGRFVRSRTTIFDMTAHESLEQEKDKVQELFLERRKSELISQAKSRFLATMSHDLRSPLNAIIGFSELLLWKFNDEEVLASRQREKENLLQIAKAGRHLLNLVEGLLDSSAIESGKISLKKERIDLQKLLEDLAKTYEMLVTQKAIRWFCEIKVTKPIFADRYRIMEIMNNLIHNAIKFTPTGGSIALGAKDGDHDVLIFVKDTGIGIDPADMERIFIPFEQGSGSDQSCNEKGVGLGLAICRKLAELHGGSLMVESTRGVGSCFTLAIPYEDLDPS